MGSTVVLGFFALFQRHFYQRFADHHLQLVLIKELQTSNLYRLQAQGLPVQPLSDLLILQQFYLQLEMRNIEFYLKLVDDWKNDDYMSPIPWVRDIEDAAEASTVKEMTIFRLKVNGVMLAWFYRWRMEGGLRDWSRLKQDFLEETRLRRTADITMSEVMEVKQQVNETTLNYQSRMESNVKLLLASPTDDGMPFKLEPQVERVLSLVFCRGLLPGHPFKVKNKDVKETLTLTYAAVAKYGDFTFESRTRDANPPAYTLPLERSFEHRGIKIEASKLAEFNTEFDKSATNQLSVDEFTDMFCAWQLSSLEERTPAGRAMRTVRYMNPVVARRVFGGTMLAKHIRRTSAAQKTTSS